MPPPRRRTTSKSKGKIAPDSTMTSTFAEKTFVGDWRAIEIWTADIEKALADEGDKITKSLAEVVSEAISNNIEIQSYGHEPLSLAWSNYKLDNSLDPRILIATGEYVKNIQARKNEKGDWSAGLPNELHESGVNFQDLWSWLEFGTDKMVARPHFVIEMGKMDSHMQTAIEGRGFEFLGRV